LRQASEGESLDVQRRQIEGYALMHGLTIAEMLVEEGVSVTTSSSSPSTNDQTEIRIAQATRLTCEA
jgi:hypothetical protein